MEESRQIIYDLIIDLGLGVNDVLPFETLVKFVLTLSSVQQEYFNKNFKQVVEEKILKPYKDSYQLTKKGYKAVYGKWVMVKEIKNNAFWVRTENNRQN